MVPHRFSINLNKEGYQKIINVRASDNEIHRLYISISNGTEPVELDDNIVSTIYCWKPNGEKITVDRYFKESDSGFVEIDLDEYSERYERRYKRRVNNNDNI